MKELFQLKAGFCSTYVFYCPKALKKTKKTCVMYKLVFHDLIVEYNYDFFYIFKIMRRKKVS